MSLCRTEKFNESIHSPASLSFTGMQPSNREHTLFVGIILWASYGENRYDQSASRIMIPFYCKNLRKFFLQLLNLVQQKRIRIGHTVCKIYVLIFLSKRIAKRQTLLNYWICTILLTVTKSFILVFYLYIALFPNFFRTPKAIRFQSAIIE